MAEVPVKSVLLIDDHDLIRQGLARAFERTADFHVVGQAATVLEGCRLADELEPNVVITDVRLPDGTGLEVVRNVRLASESRGIVVLTMYAGDDQLFEAMEAGASAFVAKDAPADDVVAAARHAYLAPRNFTAANLSAAMQRKLYASGPSLSPKETQILHLLADGHGVAVISQKLFISESTAKTHISKIYEKLGAANRAQAIIKAVRAGLLADHLSDD